VDWRRGSDYVGWLPLGPRGHRHRSADWVFVPQRDFFAPRLRRVVVVPSRNAYYYDRTPTVVHMDRRWDRFDRHWHNRGIEPREIERKTAKAAPRVRVRDVDRPQPARFVGGKDSELQVYRPDPDRARERASRQSRQREEPRERVSRQPEESRERVSRQREASRAQPAPTRVEKAPARREPERARLPQARPEREPAARKQASPTRVDRQPERARRPERAVAPQAKQRATAPPQAKQRVVDSPQAKQRAARPSDAAKGVRRGKAGPKPAEEAQPQGRQGRPGRTPSG
jgi:hypothetical protein